MRTILRLLALLLVPSPAGAAPILVNGSFEIGPALAVHDQELFGGSTDIPGWLVFGDSVDYLGSPWQVADGQHAIDLDGRNAVFSGVQQTFLTTPGMEYVVSFAMSGNGDGGAVVKMLEASVANLVVQFAFDTTGYIHEAPTWETMVLGFIAIDTTSTLAFRSLSAAPSSYGALLDNVVVVPVPEPSTLVLIGAGLTSLAPNLRRRQQLRSRHRHPAL